jgi:pyridoxamine 5'-phosphate oxidase
MDEAPAEPLREAARWLDEARRAGARRNPDAMSLATATKDGRPSVRMVLLKELCVESGYIVFYSNYRSRKAGEIESNARAAAALYWEDFGGRQLRVEGPVVRSPAHESDAYFATRPLDSQLNAWVSEQSRPVDDLEALQRRAAAKAAEFGIAESTRYDDAGPGPLTRPEFWGGYRLWIESLELWLEGQGRFHRRFSYTRQLEPQDDFSFAAGSWTTQTLQP